MAMARNITSRPQQGKKVKTVFYFANEAIMNRDKDFYYGFLKSNGVENIEYTTEFDPQSHIEDYDEVHWIIDESDELIFGNPQDFYDKLQTMRADDTITCLTATPCKSNPLEKEHRFV